MKSQTLIKSGIDKKYNKLNEGDHVFAFQCNRVKEKPNGDYQLETNMDWSFDDNVDAIEVKSFLGSILSSIEEVFGEKMVTEAIMHYADEKDHLIKTPAGAGLHFRSKGLAFGEIKKRGD
jgi:hypothetical protein